MQHSANLKSTQHLQGMSRGGMSWGGTWSWKRTRHGFTHDYVRGIEYCVGDETAFYPHLSDDFAACVACWRFFSGTFIGDYGETLG